MASPRATGRAHPRARARLRVAYQWGNRMGTATTADLSEGGAFVACEDVAPAGTRIYLRLHLPTPVDDAGIQVIGLVRRGVLSEDESHQGMGIHFEVATASARAQIADVVRQALADTGEVPDQRGDGRRESVLPPASPRRWEAPASEVGWQRVTAGTFRFLLVLVLVGVLAYVMLIVVSNVGGGGVR